MIICRSSYDHMMIIIHHPPPYYYLSEVETNVAECNLEPSTRDILFANQFLCNASSQLKVSLCCIAHIAHNVQCAMHTMHCGQFTDALLLC